MANTVHNKLENVYHSSWFYKLNRKNKIVICLALIASIVGVFVFIFGLIMAVSFQDMNDGGNNENSTWNLVLASISIVSVFLVIIFLCYEIFYLRKSLGSHKVAFIFCVISIFCLLIVAALGIATNWTPFRNNPERDATWMDAFFLTCHVLGVIFLVIDTTLLYSFLKISMKREVDTKELISNIK